MHYLPLLDNLSLSGSLKLNRNESFTSQKRDSTSSAAKRASISTAPLTASSSILSPVSDTPLTSVSIARHFELPVVMEEEEEVSVKESKETTLDNKSQTQDEEDEVFSPLNEKTFQVKSSPSSEDGDDNQQHLDASTQTSSDKGGGDDEDLVNIVMRDVLYKYIPLPPSTTTTPSVSHCNLENY